MNPAAGFLARPESLFVTIALSAIGLVLATHFRLSRSDDELQQLQARQSALAAQHERLEQSLPDLERLFLLPGEPPLSIEITSRVSARRMPLTQTPSAGGWREIPFRLRECVAHEEILLRLLADWRSRSYAQHRLRACRLQRKAACLEADCQLALLLPAG